MINQYVRNISLFMTLTLTILAMGTGPAHAGPGTLATEAGGSPSGGTFYANSPAGVWTYTDTLNATRSSNSGTALRKFVDKLPGLGLPGCTRSTPFGTGSCNENNLGQYIPLAQPVPVISVPAGTPTTGVDSTNATVASDYYELATVEYTEQLHSDLPKATKLKGYVDVGNGKTPNPHYLGATILAVRDKPVRIKMENRLSSGLFLPLDTTYMGAGNGPPIRPNGTLCTAAEEIADPINCVRRPYSQNRIAIHLHGGHTPWISDGTPHQWFTPANETSLYKKGASFQNVPDMLYDPTTHAPSSAGNAIPDPGPGFQTLYYTNQQSARLMFYHDHAFGTTRLNVYSGMAAGYLLVDPPIEDPLIANGTLPGTGFPAEYKYGIPLVIQDKTFVPADIAVQDTKWDTVKWGAPGDLWFPHVYETNQDPFFPGVLGANNFGRWDFGPWFWPPLQYCGQPGAPAPPICIDLNNPKSLLPGQPVPYWDVTATPEAFMDTALVNGTVYPYLDVAPQAYRFRILSAANDRPLNLQMYVSDPTSPGNFIQPATGMPTEVAMVSANLHPDCTATSPLATSTVPSTCTCTAIYAPFGCYPSTWPTDGRAGGVPDPQFAGPKFIQIGNESGWLPKPVVIDNQPVSYDYNRRNIVVLDILDKSLLLGPAERADVIVDFSAFAGQTIILYNDSPAPMPAFDVRYDYYTGDPNQLAFGGSAPTLPGYGPNTRTIMQFRVATGVPQNATPIYNSVPAMAALTSAISGAFTASQPTPIVPEIANGGTSNVYSTIFDNSLTFTPVGSTTATTVGFKSKAIQELWDPFGRMNATLGVELPKTNNTIQTTIPLGYNDPVTETLNQDGVQLWKVTHNGVDTHPVHFHLTDVQLINRVGWDGAIRPPDDNEVGWKETVRMKPLEDVVVALRPSMPFLPFLLPESSRLHDPSEPEGATLVLTSPDTGNLLTGPVTINALENFGYEFVWHCHILGHEENDFMRPVVFTVQTAVPPALTLTLSPTVLGRPNMVDLSWNDISTAVNAVNYYQIQRAPDVTGNPGAFTTIATVSNTLTYTDTTVTSSTTYWYQVVAFNSKGSTTSLPAVSIVTSNWNPTTVVLSTGGLTTFDSPATINLSAATTTGAGVTISRVEFFAGTQRMAFKTVGPSPYTFTWSGVFPGNYILTAHAIDSTGAVIVSNSIPVTVNVPPPAQIVRTGVTYANVQLAYNAALTGDTIKVQTGIDTGTLLANRVGINVTLSGGYDVGFVTNLGMTTLHSIATVNQGSIRTQQIKIIQ